MIGLILGAIVSFAKDTGRVLFLLARQALLVAKVVKGHLVALSIMQARAALLQIALWIVLFTVLRTAWGGLSYLFGTISDWTGMVSSLTSLVPNGTHAGVYHAVFRSLDLNSGFNAFANVFLAWVSGWGVYKSLEYAAAISSIGKVGGFWKRI